jgi:hypothetical protein
LNFALRGCGHRIETDQRAGRHDDLAALFLGERQKLGIFQKLARAERHQHLSRGQYGGSNFRHHGGGRAFDNEIGCRDQFRERKHWRRAADFVEKAARLRTVAHGNAHKLDFRNRAARNLSRDRPADRAKSRYAHPHLFLTSIPKASCARAA